MDLIEKYLEEAEPIMHFGKSNYTTKGQQTKNRKDIDVNIIDTAISDLKKANKILKSANYVDFKVQSEAGKHLIQAKKKIESQIKAAKIK